MHKKINIESALRKDMVENRAVVRAMQTTDRDRQTGSQED